MSGNRYIDTISTPPPYEDNPTASPPVKTPWPVRGRGADFEIPVRIIEKDDSGNTVGKSSAKIPMDCSAFLPPATSDPAPSFLRLSSLEGRRMWARPQVVFIGYVYNDRSFKVGVDVRDFNEICVITFGEDLQGRAYATGWFPVMYFNKGAEIKYTALGWEGFLRPYKLRTGFQANHIYCSTRHEEVAHIAIIVR